jgi:dTDP-4-amino-4,6-dideoxygalactose transaminase
MIDTKVRNIPFSPPDITDVEIEEVIKAMKSGWITTGPRTKKFEAKIAEFVGVNKAVCLNSATSAMELTLRILGIGPGDEVITSAYTYTASASVIDHVGAKIILVDTTPNSFEMDYEKLADAITERTKMIIPVDIAGKMCDYDTVYEVVESKKELFRANNDLQTLFNRVIVMADAAHAFGAKRKGLNCGQVADFTCFSFHAVKNVTTAEGGAVVWRNDLGLDDDEMYKQFMLYSLHGQSKDALAKTQKGAWEYDIVYPAYKCNMTDILAGFGLIQLSRYEGLLERRKEIVDMYDKALRPLGIKTLEHYGDDFSSTGHLYLARIPGIDETERNEIIIKMAEAGIACNVHYKPLPMFTAYKNLGFDIKDYPNAYRQYANEITLPLHTLLSDEDVEYICGSFKDAINEVLNKEAAVSQAGCND